MTSKQGSTADTTYHAWGHVVGESMWYFPNAHYEQTAVSEGDTMGDGWYGDNQNMANLWDGGKGVGTIRPTGSRAGGVQLWSFRFFDTGRYFTVGPCRSIRSACKLVEIAIRFAPGYVASRFGDEPTQEEAQAYWDRLLGDTEEESDNSWYS